MKNLNSIIKELKKYKYDPMFVNTKLFYPTNSDDLFHRDLRPVTCSSITGYLY